MNRTITNRTASGTFGQDKPATSTPKHPRCFVNSCAIIAVAFLSAAGFFFSSTAWAGAPGVPIKKSLVIGIDGMGFGEQGFSVTPTPWMDSLIDGTWMSGYQGAYSDQAFAGGVLGTATQQATVSGPGWSTILTGVWRDQHNVNSNGDSFINGFFSNSPRSGFPSNLPYLGTLEETIANIYTASYVWWDPIDDIIISSLDFDGVPNNELDFHQAYGFDPFVAAESTASVSALNDVDPAAIFVSFDLVDGAGHACGSSGLCFREAIETADGYVGQLLSAISNRSNFTNEDWQIVITADHGHRAFGGHGGQSDLERTIPFIVASQSVQQGILYPSEGGAPISHADVAPTVLDHFGVAFPSNYWGDSRAPGAINPEPPPPPPPPTFGNVVTFDELPEGTIVDGMVIGIVTFGSSLPDASINGGPGITTYIDQPNIEGNTTGVLTLAFATPVSELAYGFALSTATAVELGTSMEIFDNDGISLGSFTASAGDAGFFVVEGVNSAASETPIHSATITFNSTNIPRFAFDNLRFKPIPEPTTLALTMLGTFLLSCLLGRRSNVTRPTSL